MWLSGRCSLRRRYRKPLSSIFPEFRVKSYSLYQKPCIGNSKNNNVWTRRMLVYLLSWKCLVSYALSRTLQGRSPFKKVTSEMYHLFFLTLRKWAAKCNCNYFLTLRKWAATPSVECPCSTPCPSRKRTQKIRRASALPVRFVEPLLRRSPRR